MEGNTALGASSPAKPAFTRPEPLSHTRAVVSSSSHMVASVKEEEKNLKFCLTVPVLLGILEPEVVTKCTHGTLKPDYYA